MGGHSFGAYSTTKWALRGLGRCAALELAPHGIRVNTVCPGLFLTGINRGQPYLAALAARVFLPPFDACQQLASDFGRDGAAREHVFHAVDLRCLGQDGCAAVAHQDVHCRA